VTQDDDAECSPSDAAETLRALVEQRTGEVSALKLRVGVLEKALGELTTPPTSPAGRVRIWEGRYYLEPAWCEIPIHPVEPA
jgi:hypothetical protein